MANQLAQLHWLEYWQLEQAWQLVTQVAFQGQQECQWQLCLVCQEQQAQM
jgi:hypothetical protein